MILRTSEFWTGLVFIFFSIFYLFYLTPNFVTNPFNTTITAEIAWTLRPETLPILNICVFSFFSFLLMVQSERNMTQNSLSIDIFPKLKLILIIILSFVYTALLPIIGYSLLSPVFLGVLILVLGVRRWWLIIAVAITMPLLMQLFFFQMFQVILPEGSLWN